MKTASENRRSHVLVYGRMDSKKWLRLRGEVKGGLQSVHMGWSFTSALFSTVEKVVAHIKERDDLEIVYILDDGLDRRKLVFDVKAIADAICKHEHKPWIVLDRGLEYLAPVLKSKGVEAQSGMLEDIIHERWVSQTENEGDSV